MLGSAVSRRYEPVPEEPMTAAPQIPVTHVHAVGGANDGAVVTLSLTDGQGRPFVVVLPLTQARALIAPLMAAVGSAHRRQRARLGSDQAILDHLGLAVVRPEAVEVGRAAAPGAEAEVLLRLVQHASPMIDILLERDAALDLGLQLQSMATATTEPARSVQ